MRQRNAKSGRLNSNCIFLNRQASCFQLAFPVYPPPVLNRTVWLPSSITPVFRSGNRYSPPCSTSISHVPASCKMKFLGVKQLAVLPPLFVNTCLSWTIDERNLTQSTAFQLDTTNVEIPCWYPVSVSLVAPLSSDHPVENLEGELWPATSNPFLLHHCIRPSCIPCRMACSWRLSCRSYLFRQRGDPCLPSDMARARVWRIGSFSSAGNFEHLVLDYDSINQLVEDVAEIGCS